MQPSFWPDAVVMRGNVTPKLDIPYSRRINSHPEWSIRIFITMSNKSTNIYRAGIIFSNNQSRHTCSDVSQLIRPVCGELMRKYKNYADANKPI